VVRTTDEIIDEMEELVYHARRVGTLEETIEQLSEQVSLLNMVIDTMQSRIINLRNEAKVASVPPIKPSFWYAVDDVVALLDEQ
jgi:uncharacterized coiled-coil protein SlyX